MTQFYMSSKHKERFIDMIISDNMSNGDLERASLFYIISGNDDLYSKRGYVYNYNTHCINSRFDKSGVDFTSSMAALIRLGFNLYNGWSDKHTTPVSILSSLDNRNLELVTNALMIRFDSYFLEDLLS